MNVNPVSFVDSSEPSSEGCVSSFNLELRVLEIYCGIKDSVNIASSFGFDNTNASNYSYDLEFHVELLSLV